MIPHPRKIAMLDQVQLTTLKNGARVITAPQPDAQSAVVGIWVAVGGRYEPKNLGGVSHFIEHLLFKGTQTRSALEISQAVEGRGGYLNAFTGEEATCYYARIPYEKMDEAFAVLADMYLDAKLDPADVDRERTVIVEEIRMYRDQPQQLVQERLSEALWCNHPLGRPLAGEEAIIAAMPREEIDAFRRAAYTPAATVFAFSGRIDHAQCVRLVEQATAGRGKTKKPAFRKATPATPQRPITLAKRDIEQVHAALAFRIFGRNDPRRYVLRMLNGVLGENMSSRLFQSVREKHGLCYAISSTYQLFDETGALTISAGLDRERAQAGLRLTMKEIARLRNKKISPAELRRTRDYLVGIFRLGLESASNQMTWCGETLTTQGRFIKPEDVIAGINAVTADEIRALATEIFDPRRMTLSVVAPEADDRKEADWLNMTAFPV